MVKQVLHEGFRFLDDFHYEAIQITAVFKTASPRPGQNEGMRVVEEMVIDIESLIEQNDGQKCKKSDTSRDRGGNHGVR